MPSSRRLLASAAFAGLLLLAAPSGPAGAEPAPPAAVVAAVPAVPAAPAVLQAAGPLRAAEDRTEGLRVETSATYTVDLAASVVHVEHLATLTHQTPSSGAWYYTFEEFAVPTLPGATGVAATWDDGTALRFRLQPGTDEYVPAVVVSLRPVLTYGDTRTLRVTYDLPAQPPRVATYAQVNPAFATFPVILDGDPGLASARVVVPDGPEVEVVGDAMAPTSAGGSTTWSADAVADPVAWQAQVVVRDDDALVPADVAYGDGVRVLGWPDDAEWLAFTTDLARRGLPVLEEAIGRSWTVTGELRILEAATPSAYGYAGWYDHASGTIEIGDTLDARVTLHELAHAWFNGTTFEGRWIGEALADEYAALAMERLGQERPVPAPLDPSRPDAVRLVDWEDARADGPEAGTHDEYGYAASWWVAHEVAAEIGAESLSAVVAAAVDGVDAYPAATDDAGPSGPTGWQRLLDLLEQVGGSQRAEQVFRDVVVAQGDLPLLDARAAARAEYRRLLDAGAGWAPPAAVRDAMADWDFAAATAAVPAVLALLEERDALTAELDGAGLDAPGALQGQVENAGSVAEAAEQVDDAARAASALVAADAGRDDADPFTRLGLLVGGVDGDLAAGAAALDEGRYDDAAAAAERASATLGSAPARAAAVLAGLLVLAAGGVVLVRRRRSDPTPAPAGPRAPADPSHPVA
ncbi:hypothetical protein CHO01_05460 [Cellulomonas hominis]|uniref:Peptidase M1 membrane alanine aminopeptidase domain-containing protein n=1 Tax=Cellulomonas hominis TaxID=156981 RepID=A0A511F873_9CELL|nr:M1 family metallopeptidase [Cellulomonas hominis]MBB5473142.1 hypothetical protein [Cellulomonas hominis]GEL45430.1 hypothetical protein CHO01_05460 [Cellulomonas hominis]